MGAVLSRKDQKQLESHQKADWDSGSPPDPDLSHSPEDEPARHGDPGNAAGLGLLGVLVHVPAAAAETDQVDDQDQQAQAQTHGTDARQQYQRLGGGGEKTVTHSSD